MSKVRVYELARELKIESKLLLAKMKELGVEALSHQSTLTSAQIEKLNKIFGASAADKLKVVVKRRKKVDSASEEQPQSEVAEQTHEESHFEDRSLQSKSLEVVDTEAETEEAASILHEERVEQLSEKSESHHSDQVVSVHQAQENVVGPMHGLENDQAPNLTGHNLTSSTIEIQNRSTLPESSASLYKVTDEQREAIKKKIFAGATIVRKATPEEAKEAQKSREVSFRGKTQSFGEPGRKLEVRPPSFQQGLSRGFLGSSLDKSKSAPNLLKPFEPNFDSPDSQPAQKWTKKPELKKSTVVEEDKIPAKPFQAQKRSARNASRLLLEVEVQGLDDIETDVDPKKKKTVYLPSASTKKKDLKRRKDLKSTQITTPRAAYRVVKMERATITVSELAKQLSVKSTELIAKLMSQGMMVGLNENLDLDTAMLMAAEYKYEVKSNAQSADELIEELAEKASLDNPLVSRPPIVTVMGHVDHGKTSILDAIRNADVAAGEAGGITQHIGAYTVVRPDGSKVAFLDTPGHEAFSAMRARGASLTDIVILVVAADDGVMPQTKEAIAHAKNAKVPIIVVINKIDKPNTNFDRIYHELSEQGVQSEEWGGDSQFVKASALKNIGIDQLLEAIQLQAEILDLKTRYDGPPHGAVVEAHLDKGRGPIATVMVTQGRLKRGDFLVAGTSYGRVRAMMDHNGHDVLEATPSTPVAVVGLSSVPMAGDKVLAVIDEKIAKQVADLRASEQKSSQVQASPVNTLEKLLGQVQNDLMPEVALIVKADTQGSSEAIAGSLTSLVSKKVKASVIHKGIGGISESDVHLAEATGAVILGFNVRASRALQEQIDRSGVVVKYFSIIYELVDAVKNLMAGKLPPLTTEIVQGHAEVRNAINVPKLGTIAGSAVLDGKIVRNSLLRVLRDNIVIHTGKIGSLRRFKDDVREVQNGFECGISVDGFNDVRVGDILEVYMLEEKAAVLDI